MLPEDVALSAQPEAALKMNPDAFLRLEASQQSLEACCSLQLLLLLRLLVAIGLLAF